MLSPDEREILSELRGAVIAAEASGNVAYLNPAAEALLGRSSADLVGQPLTVLMPSRMHERHRAGFGRYTRTRESRLLGKPVRVPALRGDGTEIEIDLIIRMFRRPDGTDLVVASVGPAGTRGDSDADVLLLETRFQKRLYDLL